MDVSSARNTKKKKGGGRGGSRTAAETRFLQLRASMVKGRQTRRLGPPSLVRDKNDAVTRQRNKLMLCASLPSIRERPACCEMLPLNHACASRGNRRDVWRAELVAGHVKSRTKRGRVQSFDPPNGGRQLQFPGTWQGNCRHASTF